MRELQIEVVSPTTLDLRQHLPALVDNEDGNWAVVTFDELVRLVHDLPGSAKLLVTLGEWVPW